MAKVHHASLESTVERGEDIDCVMVSDHESLTAALSDAKDLIPHSGQLCEWSLRTHPDTEEFQNREKYMSVGEIENTNEDALRPSSDRQRHAALPEEDDVIGWEESSATTHIDAQKVVKSCRSQALLVPQKAWKRVLNTTESTMIRTMRSYKTLNFRRVPELRHATPHTTPPVKWFMAPSSGIRSPERASRSLFTTHVPVHLPALLET